MENSMASEIAEMNTEDAAALRDVVDWKRFPKLAEIFEHRPPENVYWHELVAFIGHAKRLWVRAGGKHRIDE